MSDIIVIGGGIIGLLTARELINEGADVTLVDMSETGRESSWAGGGIVSPLYPWRYADSVSRLASWSQAHYPSICEELHEATGVDPEFTRSGLLILETEEQPQAEAWAAAHQKRLEFADQHWIKELEPALGSETPGEGLWLPDVGQVRNPRLARAARLAIADKARILEHAEARRLHIEDGRIKSVQVREELLSTDAVVVCAGAWTGKLLAEFGPAPEIQPVKGQMVLFYAKPGQIQRIVLSEDRYVIPRRDGRVLVGSTLEHTGFTKATTAEAKEELYRKAVEMFPLLKHTPIENQWAGLRPGSPSGIPYIGGFEDIQGLYVNAGHFRNGVVLAPGSARLIADIVLDRTPILDPSPYALSGDRGP